MQEIHKEEEFAKNLNWSLWKSIVKQSLPFRRLILLLAGVMVFNALLDAAMPLMSRYAIDKMIIPKSYQGIELFSIGYLALILMQFATVFLLIDVAGRLETGINYELRSKCFRKLQAMSFSYYDRTPTGWIVARITSDINRLGDVFAWGIVDLVWGVATLILVSSIILVLNWKLALILMALIPIMVFISSKFQIKMLRSYREVRKNNSKLTHAFGEGIQGAKTTKTLVREEKNLEEFMELNAKMYSSSMKAALASALFMPLILSLSALGTGIIVARGGNAVLAKSIGYGTLVAFISYTMHLFDPISNVARIFAEMQSAQAAAERVFSLLDLKPEIESNVPMCDKWKQKSMRGEIELDNVCFAYKEGKPVLDHFNLKIKAGESIALVGETGTGKTTLVNLICRFYEPTGGVIKIDNEDYKQIPIEWIHSQLGYVQQVPHLFSGSIMENIRYGKLEASDEEVMAAAREIGADEFIHELPDGYSYNVGEGGNLLSTGQKQLLSFARVILANPALLILDEATASIDTNTEVIVQKALHRLLQNRTSIIVAHRLSTIRAVDRILLMHKGKIVEEGSHHKLMHSGGAYHKLYTNQFLQEVTKTELSKA